MNRSIEQSLLSLLLPTLLLTSQITAYRWLADFHSDFNTCTGAGAYCGDDTEDSGCINLPEWSGGLKAD